MAHQAHFFGEDGGGGACVHEHQLARLQAFDCGLGDGAFFAHALGLSLHERRLFLRHAGDAAVHAAHEAQRLQRKQVEAYGFARYLQVLDQLFGAHPIE